MNAPVLFSAGDCSIAPAHVLAAAAFWGELGVASRQSRARLACLARAAADGYEVPADHLQAASEQFRRLHGLRTVEATEGWMEAWGVSVEAFTDFLERDALRAASGGKVDVSHENPDEVSGTLLAALWPDAVFSGTGADWTHKLAARLAAAAEKKAAGLPGSLFDPAAAPGLAPDALRNWIGRLDLPVAWFDQMVSFEAAHARFAESVLTPKRLDAVMRARWTALFTMDFEMGGFQTEAAAREATLCVMEDGVAIQDICEMAGGSFQQGCVMLGDVPDEVRPRALSATEGALLPVFPWNDQYMVCRVRGKSEPSLDDSRTRETVARAVLEDAVRPLVRRHIKWAPGIAG